MSMIHTGVNSWIQLVEESRERSLDAAPTHTKKKLNRVSVKEMSRGTNSLTKGYCKEMVFH